jgi:hypothetical protein
MRTVISLASVAVVLGVSSACGDVNAALAHLGETRRLSAEIHTQFAKAADAANRAVMSESDALAATFAQEAKRASAAVESTAATLAPLLTDRDYAPEAQLLAAFNRRFAEYRTLDTRILDLAVENTNLKAQQLSYGPAQDTADAVRDALAAVVPADPARDTWQVKAQTAAAVLTVREIQVLQAPHIADADDAVMTRLEARMATSEAGTRAALASLSAVAAPESRARIAAASAALDRFMALNVEIIALSRRNTNVRALALSLDQKRTVTAQCEAELRALQDALSARSHPLGR